MLQRHVCAARVCGGRQHRVKFQTLVGAGTRLVAAFSQRLRAGSQIGIRYMRRVLPHPRALRVRVP